MANYVVSDTNLTLIADAIRAKSGHNELLEWPNEYKTSIENLNPVDMCIKTATDDIVSVSDAAQYDAKNVSIKIEPVQDLHGYDSPWPAGGGVNLLDPSTATLYTSGTYGLTFVWDSTTGALTISGTYTNSGSVATFRVINVPSAIRSNNVVGFSTSTNFRLLRWQDGEDTIVCGLYNMVQNNTYNITIYPVIYEGSTVPTSWTPYSNICPISGWDSVDWWNDPKYGGTIKWNQLFPNPENWEAHSTQTQLTLDDGVVTATLISGSPSVYAPAISLQGGTIITTVADHKYFVSCQFKPATNGTPFLRNNTAFASSYAFGYIVTPAGTWGDYANIISATSTGGAAWYIGQAGETSSISVGDSISIKNMMCIDLTEMFGEGNEPTTVETFKALFPHDYYPYDESYTETCVSAVNGDTYLHYTIPLGQTVYGGTLDVTKGKLTVNRAIVDLGTLTWTYNATYAFFTSSSLTGRKIGVRNMVSDLFKTQAWSWSGTPLTNAIWGNGSNATIYVQYPITEVSEFLSLISGHQLCYELTTPIIYQLTPQQIALLRGNNAMWADTGDATLKYFTTAFEDLAEEIGFAEGGDY